MKKFIALAIAVFMLAALAVPAFAADFTEESVETSAEVVVTYNEEEAYTITIPGAITFTAGATVTYVGNFENAKTITVTSGVDGFAVVKDEDEFAYEIKADDVALVDGVVAEIEAGVNESTNVALTFAFTEETPSAAGDYTDTLTFTVE